LTDNGYQFPEKRTTTNGRKINVTKIGSNPRQSIQGNQLTLEHAPSRDEHEVLQQKSDAVSIKVNNDIQDLKAEVTKLQAALQEKDRAIEILKTQIWSLENVNAYSRAVA
jgi:predicted RNase H-like nuclease (RuvC/YqgF family)